MLDAALKLAATGRAVFPCGADKAPRVTGGFHSASTDPDTIRSWNWEGAMLGAVIPDGVIVVDIDPRNGGDQTMALFPALPKSRVVRTRSGGTHVYLAIPTDTGAGLRSQLGPGVDIKKPGKGYVIVPPSEGYKFVVGGEPAFIPDWLLVELATKAPEGQAAEASAPKFFEQFEQGTPYGVAALERQLGKLATAPDGERNNTLNTVTFSLAQLVAGGELHPDVVEDKVREVALQIGLDPDEVTKTMMSAWAAGENEPWQAPNKDSSGVLTSVAPGREYGGASGATAPTPDEDNFWVDWEADEPDLPFYVWPLLPKNAYVLVFGATEASKSMSMVGILCTSSHHGVRSSVYSLENPPATDRQRIRRWAPNKDYFRLTNNAIDFSDPRQVQAMIDREQAWGTDVIMIDTYSHAFHSRSDDGNAKAIAFAQTVRHVMAAVGCSIIVVDHTGFVGDEPRDASAKRQQVDVAILMKKAGEWRPGAPSRFTMENRKAARFSNPFNLVGEIRDGKDNALELGWIGDHPRWETS